MSIPKSNPNPPFNVTRASHAVLTVKDLGASRAFYVDAIGLVVSDETRDALYLRGTEEACHHSLVLKRTAAAPTCERVGLRVYTEEDLDKAKAYFEKAGLPARFVEAPHQGRTLHVADAVGTPLEFCATMETKPRLTVQFEQFKSAAPGRLDHFQILAPAVPKALDFYLDMGFRLSEYIAADGTDDILFVFLQRKGNPHDIVFANGSGPRFHHVAFTVSESHRLFTACDIAGAHGFGKNLEHGPGRHGPGHALFVYFRDPDRHRIELFNTHYQMMDIENEPVRWDASYTRTRAWGLPPRRAWHLEASRFAGVEPRDPPRMPDPFTLEKFLAAEG
ncbi:MAG TPA: VOC family protein [Xanthobacteraceae bacterium]